MATALPVTFVAAPRLVTTLVLLTVSLPPETPASLAPPLANPPLPVLLMFVVAEAMPNPVAFPVIAVALLVTLALTICVLLAVVAPLVAVAPGPVALPLLAPPAASITPALTTVELLPFWPVATALPVTDVAEPVLLTVLLLVVVLVSLLLPLTFAPPVALGPLLPLLVMLVVALPMPVALAFPLVAEALLLTLVVTFCVLLAVVGPERAPLPLPELAPPAASVVPALTLDELLPFCPVAVALPVLAVALPVLLTLVVLLVVLLTLLLPPLVPPVAVLPLLLPLVTVVLLVVPVAVTLPLLLPAVAVEFDDAEVLLLALVPPLLPSANAWLLSSRLMIALADMAWTANRDLRRRGA